MQGCDSLGSTSECLIFSFPGDDIEAISLKTRFCSSANLSPDTTASWRSLKIGCLRQGRIGSWLFGCFSSFRWYVLLVGLEEDSADVDAQITILQWGLDWYGAGKTSGKSVLNIPGKIAWTTMEVLGFITLLYVMNTLPEGGILSLPWENKAMGGLFVGIPIL